MNEDQPVRKRSRTKATNPYPIEYDSKSDDADAVGGNIGGRVENTNENVDNNKSRAEESKSVVSPRVSHLKH